MELMRRPLYVSAIQDREAPLVNSIDIEFKWEPGNSLEQKQKNIKALHTAAVTSGICSNPLEISSKSELEIGRLLSAFNLTIRHPDGSYSSVESAFQSSKIFTNGGPYSDLLFANSRAAKSDERLRNSGELIAFKYFGEQWPNMPRTAFYDFLYLMALNQNPDLEAKMLMFDAFSDIEFNPQKSLNCQARSAALAKASKALQSWDGNIRSLVMIQPTFKPDGP